MSEVSNTGSSGFVAFVTFMNILRKGQVLAKLSLRGALKPKKCKKVRKRKVVETAQI